MINLIDDVSSITDVSTGVLKKLITPAVYCISHAVYEAACEHEDITEIDLGVGELQIKLQGDQIRYRFIPSKTLEKQLTQMLETGVSPMIQKLEANLQERIEHAYKELL